MAIIYSKKIANVKAEKEKDGLQNVCFRAVVTYTGVDEDTGLQVNVEHNHLLGDPDPNSFTAYESLTEAEVLSWITEDEAQFYAVVEEKLQRRIAAASVVNGLPWQPEEENI